MSTAIWISREDKNDGVLCIERKEIDRKKPIHWILGADISESMLCPLVGDQQHLTRWDVAVQLLDQIHADVSNNRPNDVISLLVFNTEVTIVCKSVPAKDIKSMTAVLESKKIEPHGRTNIGKLTTAIQSLVSMDKNLQEGKYDLVELTFTDGIANEGFIRTTDLVRQKKECLEHFESKFNLHPFVWSGAISCSAKWDLAKRLAGCSVFGTWAHIKENEITKFAAEVGGVVSTVLNSSICQVDIPVTPSTAYADTTYVKKSILVMGTTPNYFYFKMQPVNLDDCKKISCNSFVSVFKIQAILAEVDAGNIKLEAKELKELKDKLLQRKSTDDAFIYESAAVTTEFERIKAHCLNVINDMLPLANLNLELSVPMDIGLVRTTSSNYESVQQGRDNYKNMYTKFSASKRKSRNNPKTPPVKFPSPIPMKRTKNIIPNGC